MSDRFQFEGGFDVAYQARRLKGDVRLLEKTSSTQKAVERILAPVCNYHGLGEAMVDLIARGPWAANDFFPGASQQSSPTCGWFDFFNTQRSTKWPNPERPAEPKHLASVLAEFYEP